MRTLSLFSGIGGMDLGLERVGFQIVAQCEQDPFCRAVLAKHWPGVPCFDDVRTIDPSSVPGVECVCGGFPCQDVSVAGKGAGVDAGARSGLWREMFRVIDALRPRWVVAENVPALRTRGADRVLGDLERLGYTCTPLVVGAGDVGAPHRRQRVFIVAHADQGGRRAAVGDVHAGESDAQGSGCLVAHAERDGRGTRGRVAGDEGVACGFCGYPFDLERLGRYGCPNCHGEGLGDPSRPGREERDPPALAAKAGLGGRERDAVADPHEGPGPCQRGPEGVRGGWAGPREAGPWAWPARPGEPQHPWEAPRLLELPLGGTVDGVSARLVRAANRHALRAYGNAVVPQVAEVVGAAVMRMEAAR